jgi:hypothetical protein
MMDPRRPSDARDDSQQAPITRSLRDLGLRSTAVLETASKMREAREDEVKTTRHLALDLDPSVGLTSRLTWPTPRMHGYVRDSRLCANSSLAMLCSAYPAL